MCILFNRMKPAVLEANMKTEEGIRSAVSQGWERELSPAEQELLREVALALRTIRYGSVVLMVHDGRVVELNKTERIRKNTT
jgi:hypothetical protein